MGVLIHYRMGDSEHKEKWGHAKHNLNLIDYPQKFRENLSQQVYARGTSAPLPHPPPVPPSLCQSFHSLSIEHADIIMDRDEHR